MTTGILISYRKSNLTGGPSSKIVGGYQGGATFYVGGHQLSLFDSASVSGLCLGHPAITNIKHCYDQNHTIVIIYLIAYDHLNYPLLIIIVFKGVHE